MVKKAKPELVANNDDLEDGEEAAETGLGHNSGEATPELLEIFNEYAQLDDNKKQMAKAQRDLRARAKEGFGITASVFAHEVRLRKMDSDVRIQFEQGHAGLKDMLGYQLSLDVLNGEDGEGEDDPEAAATRLSSSRKKK